jgi:predicted alpha/beta superfamily hydrolase
VGSSLGGLRSAYAGTPQADAFGLIGAFSPSTWWDSTVLLTKVAQSPASPRPLRVYVDSGDSGPSSDDKDNTARLAQAYRVLGYAEPTTLKYVVQPGATHSEVYWAQRLPAALSFLLGPRSAQ